MGQCIICGTSVDGVVCRSHQEDVAFRFTGSRPDQLTAGRFYEGTVDGFADFGVFVDIGDSVTGLLHRSELDRRLESLDWDEGDTVYVQVTGVQDNGNIDLSWSIRQSSREFRGEAIDSPEGDYLPGKEEEPAPEHEPEPRSEPEPEPESRDDGGSELSTNGGTATVESESATPEPIETGPPARVTVEALEESIGERVSIEGRVVDIRQTGGPTIFEVRDESGVAECAAFKEAGVRAYPDIEGGDLIRLTGEVERRRGGIQVETESLKPLAEADADAVVTRLDDALEAEAHPGEVEPLAEDPALAGLTDAIADAAGEIRRAVIESRPIVLRHTATADGYVAGVAIERAVLPLIREQHDRDDAQYHYFDRQPLEGEDYDMGGATSDVTRMLDNHERHDEKLPLVVLVDTGSTAESRDGIELLDVYDVSRLVIDADSGFETADLVEGVVPDEDSVTTTVLAANVACGVNDVREEISHLPAVSYWEEAPEAYTDLAREAGYDTDTTRELREAVALEAYYQSYEDKRELIADLLFAGDEEVRSLASHVSEQFRAKLDDELDAVRPHVAIREESDVTVAVLDTDAFTHRFDFPPTALLLDALFRDLRAEYERLVVVGLDEADLQIRSTEAFDVREFGKRVTERVPEGGVLTAGVRRGRLSFLIGEREAVREAAIEEAASLAA
ncbi:polyribonucleotide nucleotidyltransferase [Halalkalicoccus paucihalophilus]|uniref:Polyribonucleotide nucleotidyltransferase n=1 Tax=Halalkalicoccus paucihalophilus TaxID=1008153 RepID=A0A151AGB1_9EURY|nr:OB-fold nucleic acid binding domain-containing protein [Halalkalicoccus paucihalophilus]KYH26673.1 polyribonucleotide nucleotidyltransferase [Halalkalicoccus paucihalophilus]